jgi:class 3 adenylate cyclase
MAGLSRAELFKLLDRRIADPTIADAQDQEIWETCGAERAIFVLDLSGFTRTTRARGILHFLTVYRRATQVIFPTLEENGGRIVKCEADNVLASFKDAISGLKACREIVIRTDVMNQTLPDDSRVHPCIALGFGRVVELSDDFFGDEVNVTFKLGEDVAKRREILLTESCHARLGAGGVELEVERRHIDLGGVAVSYYCLRS